MTSLLDWAGAASYLGTSVRHMKSLCYESRIDHVKVGGKVRFKVDDLDLYIVNNTVKALRR